MMLALRLTNASLALIKMSLSLFFQLLLILFYFCFHLIFSLIQLVQKFEHKSLLTFKPEYTIFLCMHKYMHTVYFLIFYISNLD